MGGALMIATRSQGHEQYCPIVCVFRRIHLYYSTPLNQFSAEALQVCGPGAHDFTYSNALSFCRVYQHEDVFMKMTLLRHGAVKLTRYADAVTRSPRCRFVEPYANGSGVV